MVNVFKELIAAIPNFAQWTKQERIAFVVWYYASDGGAVDKHTLERCIKTLNKSVDTGISPEDITGGKFFAELTDGKRKKPLLEKVKRGAYRASEHGMARFQKYVPKLLELDGAAREDLERRLEQKTRDEGDW